MEKHDVVVIGGGPAGLAIATRLQERGVNDVVVLERETAAGGVPRHCGHWGFGWESHRRLMTGPAFAQRLRRDAAKLDVRTSTTVLEFRTPEIMRVHRPAIGIVDMEARHVVLATGARESSRAARFLGGSRFPSIINTGNLQQQVYLKGLKPFSRPVIIGGEWVSFSALMTCKHAGIKPVAMLVEEPTIEAPAIFKWGARLRYGVPIVTGVVIIAIHGKDNIESIEFEHRGKRKSFACDGVIVSGKFVGETALLASGPLAAGPMSHVSCAGNMRGELKTAGRCVVEARSIADDIAGKLK